MSTRLTRKRLDAIIEALTARTAGGENETSGTEGEIPLRVYDEALDWALETLVKRQNPRRLVTDETVHNPDRL